MSVRQPLRLLIVSDPQLRLVSYPALWDVRSKVTEGTAGILHRYYKQRAWLSHSDTLWSGLVC